MRKTKFQINEDKVFEGYSADTFWNGWDEPCFTKETAQEVLDYYLNQECKESAADWRECFQEILETITSEILLKDLTVFYPEKYEEIVPFLRNEIIKQLKEVK